IATCCPVPTERRTELATSALPTLMKLSLPLIRFAPYPRRPAAPLTTRVRLHPQVALTFKGLIQAAMVRVAERLSPVVVESVTLPETPSKFPAWPNWPAVQVVPPSRLPVLPLPEESLARLPAPSSNL